MKIAGKLLLILIIGVVLAFLSGNAIRNFMSYHFHHFPGKNIFIVAHADELNSGGYSKLYWHSYPIWNTPTLVMPFSRKIVIPFVYMGHFAASPRPSVFAKATP